MRWPAIKVRITDEELDAFLFGPSEPEQPLTKNVWGRDLLKQGMPSWHASKRPKRFRDYDDD